ncbi:uroporphyrinogen decarboxylase [Campylobacter hyointestinalis]|uniref:Uroporphyrinogen decarboxylase n=1 Tax=Campylobacter hyointestinalis subsp. hyointestinalis TaxID=91352 RepID=A0A9W5AP51_CAMHY|nr:uroporphyrinogen decarboxylase [Campylobacter hyointestinalis]ANE33106.1 uroporphyrinogen decarboxylase [Campylobacter hyointestinalis subsp. hyointestinalis LMG 9260]KEA44819.1 uroporphyrinogen decarboxylase [Campylobacter hyointestinalis subsp. hyointestinalis]MDL2346436.1 uroporphyrinogen decarboxylase [Campylobacter hyointestinalis]MDL2348176.1 uroporphyrinogen decarboxylase [Campylobacter hyointestinalis]MDL2349921.1 uroporphyrinogen decarboxylase [Campylobacter hyointestinalis]
MIFIDACFGKHTDYTPVWMMRQAGRYLPEYMKVREQAGDFLSLCKDYKKASEVTLQPVDILGVDAAIMFSDILVVPLEMGMDLKFVKGEGPVFENPINSMEDLDKLSTERAVKHLDYVYDTIKLTRDKLAKDKALIGFCGAPWTIATYMIEGGSTKTYNISKKMVYDNPQLLHAILRKVTNALKLYLEEQIKAGVDAVQIFDSWASALEESAYMEFGFSYINEIVDYIKERYPHIAVIVFPKGISGFLSKITGKFDVFGVDWSTPLKNAKEILGKNYVLQGNMEPTRLYNKDAIDEGVSEILSIMRGSRHIFNLGHGILPDVPVENAKYFIKSVQEKSAKYCK